MRECKGRSIIAFPEEYVVIDTETTGLDCEFCDIIEIAALRFSRGQLIDQFTSLVRPRCCRRLNSDNQWVEYYVDDFISSLTGITNEMLENAPDPETVIPKFQKFIGDSILIGHNVNFDINFLYDAVDKHTSSHLSNDFIDTLRVSRKVFPQLQHHRLSDIAAACQVIQAEAHRAEADCLITAACYERIKQIVLSEYTEDEFMKQFKHQSHYHQTLASITATTDSVDETNPLFGKVVVFTGALSKMERKAAFQIVANLGGIPKDSITSQTNYLVIGNEEFAKTVKNGKTGKMRKAEEYQKKGQEILILSENAFFDMVEPYLDRSDETQVAPTTLSESRIFEILKPTLLQVIEKNNANPDKLIFKMGNDYSSVWYDSQMAFRIYCRGKKQYFSVSDARYQLAPEVIQRTLIKADAGFQLLRYEPTPVGIERFSDYFSALLDMAIDSIAKEFDCCSRFEECSNAKRCIHPNPDVAVTCGYRKVMKSGRYFYGVNRNID